MADRVAQAAVGAVADERGDGRVLGRGQGGGGRAQRDAPEHDRALRPAADERGGGVHVVLLEEAEGGDVAAAGPVVAQVEQHCVPAQAVQEGDLAHHLDARAVQAVHEDHGAPRLPTRGHPPALQGHAVAGVEGDLLVGEAEGGGRDPRVLPVVVDEAAGRRQPGQPPRHPAEHERRQRHDRDEDDPLDPLHRRPSALRGARCRGDSPPAAGNGRAARRLRRRQDDSRGARGVRARQGTGRGRDTDLIGRVEEASPGAWIQPRRAVTSSQWHVPSGAHRTLRPPGLRVL